MSVSSSTRTVDFLCLAREVRDLIYEAAITSDLPYQQELVSTYEITSPEHLPALPAGQHELSWPTTVKRFHADPPGRHGASLRQTCRQVRSEFDEAYERSMRVRDTCDTTTWRVDVVFDPVPAYEQEQQRDRGPLVHWRQLPCPLRAVRTLAVTLWLGNLEPWNKCRYGLYSVYRARHQLFMLLNLLRMKGPVLWSPTNRSSPLQFDFVDIEERVGVHPMFCEPGPQAKVDCQTLDLLPFRRWMRSRGLERLRDFVSSSDPDFPVLYWSRNGGMTQSFGEFQNQMRRFNRDYGVQQAYPPLPIFLGGILGPEEDPWLWSLGEHDIFDGVLVQCRVSSVAHDDWNHCYTTLTKGHGWSNKLRWKPDTKAQRIS